METEPLIGSIGLFGGNFAPRSWALCQGQLLAISSNSALFSILGTIYGGDGRTTFGLPDLRGRIPIQQGTGPGLSNYRLGNWYGIEQNTLSLLNLANHTHGINPGSVPVALSGLTGTIGGSATAAFGVNSTQGTDDPNGGYFATNPNGESTYSGSTDGNFMAEAPVSALGLSVSVSGTASFDPSSIQLGMQGKQQAVTNLAPSLGLNYCIALYGIYPSRS